MEPLEDVVAKKPVHPQLRHQEEKADRQPRAFDARGKRNGAGKKLEHACQGQKQSPFSGGCNSLLQKGEAGKPAGYEKKSDKIRNGIQGDQLRINQKQKTNKNQAGTHINPFSIGNTDQSTNHRNGSIPYQKDHKKIIITYSCFFSIFHF